MAKEILAVPEEYLGDVIYVIRRGLMFTKKGIDKEVFEQLTKWCDNEEKYPKMLRED